MVFGSDSDIKLTVSVDDAEATKKIGDLEDDIKRLDKTAESAGSGFSKLERSLVSLGSGASGLKSVIDIASSSFDRLISSAESVGDAIQRGFEVQGVTNSFNQLVGATQDAEQFLQDLTEATRGTVTQFDLMTQANQAVLLGLPTDQFDELASAALRLGTAVGNSAKESIDSLVGALGRGSTELLDNLGVTLKAAEAQERYAAILDKSVDSLTEEEKAQAFRTVAIEKIISKSEELAEVENTAGLAVQQLTTAYQDQIDNISLAISENEALGQALSELASVIRTIDFEPLITGITSVATAAVEATAFILDLIKAFQDIPQGIDFITPEQLDIAGFDQQTEDLINKFIELANAGVKSSEDLKRLESALTGVGTQIDNLREKNLLRADQIGLVEKLRVTFEALKTAFEGVDKEGKKVAGTLDKVGDASGETGKINEKAAREAKRLERSFEALDKRLRQLGGILPELTEEEERLARALAEGGEAAEEAAEELRQYLREVGRTPKALEAAQDRIERITEAQKEFADQNKKAAAEIKKRNQEIAKSFEQLGEDIAAVFDLNGPAAKAIGRFISGLFGGAGGGVFGGIGKEIFEIFGGVTDPETGEILEGGFFGDVLETFGFNIGDEKDVAQFTRQATTAINGASQAIGSTIEAFQRDTADAFAIDADAAIDQVADDIKNIGQGVLDVVGAIFLGGIPLGTILEQIGILDIASEIDAQILAGLGVLGSQDPATLTRRAFTNFLNEAFDAEELALVIDGQLKKIPGLSRSEEIINSFFEGLDVETPEGLAQFEGFAGISIPLTLLFDPDNELGLEQLGAILGSNLENLNNLQIAFETIGLGADQLGAGLEEAFLQGQITATQFLQGMQAIENITTQGIPDGVGLIDTAFANLIQSAGVGRLVLDALGDLAAETFEKLGDDATLEDLKNELIAAGVEAEKVDELFAAFAAAGITSLEQLRDIGVQTAAVVASQLEGLGDFFEELDSETADALGRIESIPDDTEKRITFRISTETDGETEANREIIEDAIGAPIPDPGQGQV